MIYMIYIERSNHDTDFVPFSLMEQIATRSGSKTSVRHPVGTATSVHVDIPLCMCSARVEAFAANAEAAMEARLQQMREDIEANLHTQWVEGKEQVCVLSTHRADRKMEENTCGHVCLPLCVCVCVCVWAGDVAASRV